MSRLRLQSKPIFVASRQLYDSDGHENSEIVLQRNIDQIVSEISGG